MNDFNKSCLESVFGCLWHVLERNTSNYALSYASEPCSFLNAFEAFPGNVGNSAKLNSFSHHCPSDSCKKTPKYWRETQETLYRDMPSPLQSWHLHHWLRTRTGSSRREKHGKIIGLSWPVNVSVSSYGRAAESAESAKSRLWLSYQCLFEHWTKLMHPI